MPRASCAWRVAAEAPTKVSIAMNLNDIIERQLDHTLKTTNFPKLGERYQGKVRDVYRQGDRLVMITTDRVSAFDRVLGTVPFKGAVLNAMAAHGFEATRDIVPNHLLSAPDPNVVVAKACRAYPVEFIVRGYITGSLWRDYQSGKAAQYGLSFPSGLRKDERFSAPMLTPTTKAEQGEHDEPISREQIVERGLLTRAQLEEAENVALQLFARGSEQARKQGLILVDTKYELGRAADDRLTLIDEIHTPDSSRYWIGETYQTRFDQGVAQAMLDKENLRGWLIEHHQFTGEGEAPPLSKEIRATLTKRYFEAYAFLTGKPFEAAVSPDVVGRIAQNLDGAGLLG